MPSGKIHLHKLIFFKLGGLARDQYGMQHEGLFSRAITGTKRIILLITRD
jgi:hypothetical protein